MEKRQTKETKINLISDADRDSIRLIIQKLEDLAALSSDEELNNEPLISEASVHTLESIVIDLLTMKDTHQKYLLRWVKQGYLLD